MILINYKIKLRTFSFNFIWKSHLMYVGSWCKTSWWTQLYNRYLLQIELITFYNNYKREITCSCVFCSLLFRMCVGNGTLSEWSIWDRQPVSRERLVLIGTPAAGEKGQRKEQQTRENREKECHKSKSVFLPPATVLTIAYPICHIPHFQWKWIV